MSDNSLGNIVVSLLVVCEDYKSVFYPKIKKFVVDPPMGLRCGIARGKVFSVGDGNDYVGSCINIAARLQKLSLLTFCVSRRGFDFEKCMVPNAVKDYLLKAVSLRGIGANELVWVLRDEFNKLPDAEKGLFTNP
jgi:class 3 adenylate cyclase